MTGVQSNHVLYSWLVQLLSSGPTASHCKTMPVALFVKVKLSPPADPVTLL